MALAWVKVCPNQWKTAEQRDGVPDFRISHCASGYRLKMRSARQVQWFDTLDEAKAKAEAI